MTQVYIYSPFQLILSDNLLVTIPYQQMAPLKALRILDLSHNEISEILHELTVEGPNMEVQLNLDTLYLDFNKIQELPTGSFKMFQTINRTFLDGNAIHTIEVRMIDTRGDFFCRLENVIL